MEKTINKKHILITGSNADLVMSLYPILEKEYTLSSCRPVKQDFRAAVLSFCPKLVLICMKGETDEELDVYNSLRTECGGAETPVLAAGTADEKNRLLGKMTDNNVFFLNGSFSSEYLLTRIKDVLFNCDTSDIDVYKARELVVEDYDEKKRIPVIRRPNVLLVSPKLSELRILKTALIPKYSVVAVSHCDLAYEELESGYRADIIVLDYTLADGIKAPEATDKLKSSRRSSAIPILVLVNMSDPPNLEKTFRTPPDSYYLKPFFRSYNFNSDFLKSFDKKMIDVLLAGPRKLRAKLPDNMYR